MNNIWKYLIYAIIAVFAFVWIKVAYNQNKAIGTNALSENVATLKEKTGRVVGDLIEDEADEDDKDFGDGEDDLDADELDEDEILTEDWDEEDDSEEEVTPKEAITNVTSNTNNSNGEEAEEEASQMEDYEEAEVDVTRVVTTTSNGRFLVIGGSFSTKNNANTFVKQLGKLGYEDAEVVIFDTSKKYHTVSVARFDSKNDASKLVGALKGKGIKDAYVHKKRG